MLATRLDGSLYDGRAEHGSAKSLSGRFYRRHPGAWRLATDDQLRTRDTVRWNGRTDVAPIVRTPDVW